MNPKENPAAQDRNRLGCFFKGQRLHAALLIGLLGASWLLGARWGNTENAFLLLGAQSWFILSLGVPVAHQVFVWASWRSELCFGAVTKTFGPKGFEFYAAIFSFLGIARVLVLLGLAISDRDSLGLPLLIRILLLILLTPLAAYTGYSVARYFGFRRAFGIDHFDTSYRKRPLERRGIFRHTRNAMYWFGFLVLWIIAIACDSRLALVSVFFSHAYIWVHYHCTEKPDMKRIYEV
ncbi:MAG: hypothetical protein HYY21_04455 [Candidatus Tectomicrobia bacterium]|nr:hypothetical protein [Candidatus Tectomicrobia bacterium]